MTMDLLLPIALVLSGTLLAIVAVCAIAGAIGLTTGAGLERCDRCHRIGLAAVGQVHRSGCPVRHRDGRSRGEGWRRSADRHGWLKITDGMPLVLVHDLIAHARPDRG